MTYLFPVTFLKRFSQLSQSRFQLCKILSHTMNLVSSFIDDLKNEIKKGIYPNTICLNDFFDMKTVQISKEIWQKVI